MRKILIVDDNEGVRDIVVRVLGATGYEVVSAAESTAALSIIGNDRSIGLLLTDIAMPGMDGIELARRAKLLRPELAIIYISAHACDLPPDGRAVLHGPLIKKPWANDRLREQVAKALKTKVTC